MDINLIITLCIIAVGIVLFVKDYFTIDTTSILIMALFIVSNVLTPEEGFSGFNHPATITLGCMFVVSAAVFKSGLLDGVGSLIIRLSKIHFSVALISICCIAAIFSAFINDAAVVALFLPVALQVSRETNISPSKLLIPISFSALFGGTCTLIGTSTNILVSSYAEKYGFEPFGMFEFTLPAVCIAVIGLIYILTVGQLLLPNRKGNKDELVLKAEEYTCEVIIEAESPDLGKKIETSALTQELKGNIIAVNREGIIYNNNDGKLELREGDILKMIMLPSQLSELRNRKGYSIQGDNKDDFAAIDSKRSLYEVMVPYSSPLAGKTLNDLNFRNNFNVLALRQREDIKMGALSNVVLREGNLMLISATKEELSRITEKRIVITISEYKSKRINYKKAIPTLIVALGVILVAAFNITSILISAMVGSLVLVASSMIKPKEAYEAIEWKVLFMMAGVLSMGTALEKTGGAKIAAEFIQQTLGQYDPRITLSILFLIAFLSTNILSSKATAAILCPIVISLSNVMNISERPFLIAIMFACSLTFMTPMSYPTNTMVYAPGNYKFNDYLKVGTPLNIIVWIVASFLIPLFFPFTK